MPHFAVEPQAIMSIGAMRLLHTFKNDGGWQWNDPDGDPEAGIPTPSNTIGITGLGVLDAFLQLSNGDLILYYQNLMHVARPAFGKMETNAADPDPSKHRIRGPDITFLAGLYQKLRDSRYTDFAATRWASAKTEYGSGTATGFAQYIRDARKSQGYAALISWDINLYLQGLLALHMVNPAGGYDAEAVEMAEVIFTSLYVPPVDFDMGDQNQTEYWLGITGGLCALACTGVHPNQAAALVTALQNGQKPDGHWEGVLDGSDVQTTSYALLALVKASEAGIPGVQASQMEKAASYLVSQQLANGGFKYDASTENTEITAEVIQAVRAYLSD
jgi:hypothetical protein